MCATLKFVDGKNAAQCLTNIWAQGPLVVFKVGGLFYYNHKLWGGMQLKIP